MYDISYVSVENAKHIKDPKCRHKTSGIYDGRWAKEGSPTHFRGVCLICGKVGSWAKVKRGGEFTLVF